MTELSITLRIADRPYKMTIEREREEVFRKAAKMLEEKSKAYSIYSFQDSQDLLAMASLEYVVKLLDIDAKLNFSEKNISEKLKYIDGKLSKAINANV